MSKLNENLPALEKGKNIKLVNSNNFDDVSRKVEPSTKANSELIEVDVKAINDALEKEQEDSSDLSL